MSNDSWFSPISNDDYLDQCLNDDYSEDRGDFDELSESSPDIFRGLRLRKTLSSNNSRYGTNGDRSSYLPYPVSSLPSSQDNKPVELQITNLDQTIDQKEIKKIIYSIFRDHVSAVLQVTVFFQSDGNMAAVVRVPNLQDAQLAISILHRKKVGYKRILISYGQNHGSFNNPAVLRSKVVSLISEVPAKKLQLFKFREMFEKRFHHSVGVSDLYKMKDVVVITDEDIGRMVCLTQFYRNSLKSEFGSQFSSNMNSSELDSPFCLIHGGRETDNKGWAEKENDTQLPLVNISLLVLGPNIITLLKGHGGRAQLLSLVECYNADFPPIPIDNEDGVPLEHLVSCIRGVVINSSPTGVKRVCYASDYEIESNCSPYNHQTPQPPPPPPLMNQLTLFSRQLVDLLKTSPGCRMVFHKFIPSYHHHFGHQCRVADYGYTKLKELFEALPHIVQILCEGSRAIITLSHRAQIKRFTSDLLRVLKAQASKQVLLSEFPGIFEKVMNKSFKISDYGVCVIQDILSEVSETSVVVSGDGEETLISIPKREQTSDELERTLLFATECVELLRHAPDCRLLFNKFIPAYHHHFGRQCRVADYGFTKLIELFEAIPNVVEVTEDCDGERLLQLTDEERLIVIGEQIAALIRSSLRQSLILSELLELYTSQYGYQLRPNNFGEKSVVSLLSRFTHLLRLEKNEKEEDLNIRVYLSDRSYIKALSSQVKGLLAKKNDCKMLLSEFIAKYHDIYNIPLDISSLKIDLAEIIEVHDDDDSESENYICLVPLQVCSIKIQNLLKSNYGRLSYAEFDAAYFDEYGCPLCPLDYGFSNLAALILALDDNLTIRGKGSRKIIVLLKDDIVGCDGNNNNVISHEPRSQNASFHSSRSSNCNTSYSTRYSTLRQEGLRMYSRRPTLNSSFNRHPLPSQQLQQSSLNRYYLNELAQFGLFPSPRGYGSMIGSPISGSSATAYRKHVSPPPYGFTGTPPPLLPSRSMDSYFTPPSISSSSSSSSSHFPSFRQRSPDSLCGSESPTSSQFTDDDRNNSNPLIPSPIGLNNEDLRRNHLMMRFGSQHLSTSLFCSSSSPFRSGFIGSSSPCGLFSSSSCGPPSPCSPLLSPGALHPFVFPSPSSSSSSSSSSFSSSLGLSSKNASHSKSKLGSIFEETGDNPLFSSSLRLVGK